MGKKKKLRHEMHDRGVDDTPALVVCVGKKCCSRSRNRALAADVRAYAAASHPDVRVEVIDCLHVCEDGPVVATYPDIEFSTHVDEPHAHELVDRLSHDHARESDTHAHRDHHE